MYGFVLEQLDKSKGSWPSVAVGSGVPLRTVEKIARRETHNPGVLSIEALAEYFRRKATQSAA